MSDYNEIIHTVGDSPGNGQSDKAYNYILDKIKSNEWEAGQRIHTEKELCEILQVSRIAVRTALDKLSALGIIEKRKGSGTFLAEINLHKIVQNIVPLMTLKAMDVMDVLRFRRYFEPGNVEEFLKNCDQEDMIQLREAFETMKDHPEDTEAFYLADYRYHTILARGTKNPIIISINEMLTEIMIASFSQMLKSFGPRNTVNYHKDILAAIESGDAELAKLLMVRHIESNIFALEELRKTEE